MRGSETAQSAKRDEERAKKILEVFKYHGRHPGYSDADGLSRDVIRGYFTGDEVFDQCLQAAMHLGWVTQRYEDKQYFLTAIEGWPSE